MRAPLVTIVLATLLATLSTCASWANVVDYLPTNNIPITFKFINFDDGTNYGIADTGATPYESAAAIDAIPAAQQTAPLGANPGEDSWGLMYLDQITNSVTNELLWRHGDAIYGSTEVTGIFWGGVDSYLAQTSVGPFVTQYIGASGYHMALWEDSDLDFYTLLAGPGNRTNPANSLPSYAGATDGTLIWTFDSTPGYLKTFDLSQTRDFLADYIVNTNFTPAFPGDDTVSGGGGVFWNTSTITVGAGSFTGNANNLLGQMPISGVNLEVNFTNTTDALRRWDVQSNDPAYARTIPEPATSVLMLLGLLPVGIRLRRRSRA